MPSRRAELTTARGKVREITDAPDIGEAEYASSDWRSARLEAGRCRLS